MAEERFDALVPPAAWVAQVFDGLSRGTMVEAEAALARLDQRPAHPYLARRLVHLVQEPPFRSAAARGLWTRVFCQLLRHGDQDTLEALETLEGRYQSVISSASMGPWMESCVDEVTLQLGRKLAPGPTRDPVEALRRGDEALAQGRWGEAIEWLRPAFAALRDPELAEAIEALDQRLLPPSPLPRRPSVWLAALASGPLDSATDLSALLSPLSGFQPRWVSEGLGLLSAQPADPRVGAAAVDAMIGAPWKIRGVLAIRFVAVVGRHGDHRRLAPLRAAALERPELAHAAAALADLFPEPPALSAEASELVETISARLCGLLRCCSDDEEMGQHLLAAIYDDPHDLGARLVYADWLQERGDPRGELIALQCRGGDGPRAPAEARRVEELLRRHGASWLGPLRPIVVEPLVRFTRGFPSSVTVRDCDEEQYAALIGEPAWATVEEVDFLASGFRQGMDHEVMRALRAVGGLGTAHLQAIAASARAPQIEALGLRIGAESEPPLSEIAELLESFDRLKRLHLSQRGREDKVVQLMLMGAFRELETLSVGFRLLTLADLLVDVEHHLPELETLILETANAPASIHGGSAGWTVTLRRDDSRELNRLEAWFRAPPGGAPSPAFRQIARRVLSHLDRELVSLSVEVAPGFEPEPEDLAMLDRAVTVYHPGAELGGLLSPSSP